MKIYRSILLWVSITGLLFLTEAAEYRKFVDADGKSMKARLLGFSESTETVEVELIEKNREPTKQMSLAAFSKTDQAYIRDWYQAHSLLNSGKLRVSLKKESTSKELVPREFNSWFSMFPNIGYTNNWRSPGVFDYKELEYEITVENRSQTQLSNIRIEYCIYHQATIKEQIRKGRFDSYEPSPSPGQGASGGWAYFGGSTKLPSRQALDAIAGELLFDDLPRGEKITQNTDKLNLAEDRKETYESVYRKYIPGVGPALFNCHQREIDSTLLGIRYRIYLPTPNGDSMMFEFADPENLLEDTSWVSPDQCQKLREESLLRRAENSTNKIHMGIGKGKMPGSKK
jgi:hypothetical protein